MILRTPKALVMLAAMAKSKGAAAASWTSAFWTFPSVLGSAMLIAWAAEAAQFLISQGLALAILAWLQTLPEFAVEAAIALEASKDPEKIHLVTANFTGSLRLLTGVAWPMIFITAAFFHRRKTRQPLREIFLEKEHSVEVIGLLASMSYSFWIYYKGTLNLYDSVILIFVYIAYLYVLKQVPAKEEEDVEEMEAIPKKILSLKKPLRNASIALLFLGGGLILYFVAHPFLESMLAVAVAMGASEFVFVQWVSPFLSEFPEKVSAFHWARRVSKAPMALMNMVSSNINQWTMLIAMIPMVYSYGVGGPSEIQFDAHQKEEILLTIAQALVGFMFLLNMKFTWYEATGLFVLWLIQFVKPGWRVEITYLYFFWFGIEVIRTFLGSRGTEAFSEFAGIFRKYVMKR